MLLALDIGNTHITTGVYSDNKLLCVCRLASDKFRTEDQYAVEIRDILDINKININNINHAVIGSVVPSLTLILKRAIKKLTNITSLDISDIENPGINIKLKDPSLIGADLLAGCVAAVNLFSLPAIVFDLGTATTICVIDDNKNMLGGVITPGPLISLEALTSRSALLSSISLQAPEFTIGKTNEDCMRSGLVFGTACMIDGMCDRIEKEINNKCTIIATGGLSKDIIPHCKRNIILSDNLILEGLKILYKNSKETNL